VKNSEGFEAKLTAVNGRLSRCKLVQHSERLYVRSSHFPPKPGSSSKRPEYATGYRANLRELKLAEGMALEIDGQLLRDKFEWDDWLKAKEARPEMLHSWVLKLEADYWQRHERSLNTENTWRKSYQQYFGVLPVEATLTEDLLIKTLTQRYKAGSRSRQLCAVAFSMLARFAGLEHGKIAELGKGYRPGSKTLKGLPTDELIEYAIDHCEIRAWQWAAGVQATFGLRNHEIFRLDTSRVGDGIITVLENSKTGTRQVYACPFEWVERWRLSEVCLPVVNLDQANNAIGSAVSQWYKRLGLHRPYQYRDAYAVRLKFRGIDSAFSSRWMGHSAAVHDQSYLPALQEVHHQQIFEEQIRKI
jgi:hypothetical protein